MIGCLRVFMVDNEKFLLDIYRTYFEKEGHPQIIGGSSQAEFGL